MSGRHRILRPWTLLVGLASATPALAGEPRGAGWIAPEAAASLEIARPADVLGRLTSDPVPGLLRAFPPYRAYLDGSAYRDQKHVAEVVAARLGTTWDRALLDVVGGGVILAIEPTSPPRAVLVATPRDPAFLEKALDTILDLARDDAATKGKPDPIHSAEHRGVRGYALGPNAAMAIVNGTLVVSSSADAIKAVIDRSMDRPDPARTLAGDPTWKAQRAAHVGAGAAAWGFVRVEALRRMDPNALKVPDQVNPLATILFAGWIESLRKAPWLSAGMTTSGERLALNLTLPTPPGGYSNVFRRFVPAEGKGAPAPIAPKGMIASLGLRRDLASLWEVRADLFPPEVVQGLAQLDTVAGTFFGGRDFGTGILGALGADWRLVVARQDFAGFDPMPADKLPAFALIADLRPGDEDFVDRLRAAFQSFVGLINVGAAQSKAPPLMVNSEVVEGVKITTARYLKPRQAPPAGEPVNSRHNFSPSIAQVGEQFILGSSVGLVRDLIPALKAPAVPTGETLRVRADVAELAALVVENRPRLVMQNMLEKGNDRSGAEAAIDSLARLLGALDRGSFTAIDGPEAARFHLEFTLHPTGAEAR